MRDGQEDRARDRQLNEYLEQQEFDSECAVCGKSWVNYCEFAKKWCCGSWVHDCVRCDEGEFN